MYLDMRPRQYEERPVEPHELAAHDALERAANTMLWNKGEHHVLLGPMANGRVATCTSLQDLHDTLVGWYSTAWRAAGGSYVVPEVDSVIDVFLHDNFADELRSFGWQ